MRSPSKLLHEIQDALLDEPEVSRVLLKLRLLAARIGSGLLEEWVKHETEGYPAQVEVPDYRMVPVEYTGTFSDGVRTLNDVQIPSFLVKKFAGEDWVRHCVRQPLAEIEHFIQRIKEGKGGTLALGGTADLILLLQGKVYKGMGCLGVSGSIPDNLLINAQTAVKGRVMDLTLQLEAVVSDDDASSDFGDRSETINQIANSTIFGNVTFASSIGSQVMQTVQPQDTASLAAALRSIGLREEDAQELADIVSCEAPEEGRSVGTRAMEWITQTFGAASRQTMVNLLSEVISRFYA